jgi:hypothetical protein
MNDGILRGVHFQEKDLQTISKRISSEGSSFAKVTIPLLGKALSQGLITGTFSCPSNFSLDHDRRLPKFCGPVFQQIFQKIDGRLLERPNTIAIQTLRQFLSFDEKLFFEPTSSMTKAAVESFADRMDNLRRFSIDKQNPTLLLAAKLIGRVLRNLDLSDIVPGHGPGATAEHLDRFERWSITSWPSLAERYYPYVLHGVHSIRASLERGKYVSLVNPTTRICLVPKDFRAPRLISAESAATQFLQQGQMKSLMKYLSRKVLFSKSVRLNDQTFNQQKCKESYSKDYATLDLSNASDTISVPLFWFLFKEVPLLRRQLMSTRSSFGVYSDGAYTRRIRITSFAPMGSAVCFPVETIIFWALAMASLRLCRPLYNFSLYGKQLYQRWSEVADDVAVFGDDIIIPNGQPLQNLITTLRSVGCEPNMQKTCYLTPFRESCGAEYFGGIDVTIIRNKRYNYSDTRKIVHYPVLLDLQRKFFLRGYRNTACLLREWARNIWPIICYKPREFEDYGEYCNSLESLKNRFECAYSDISSVDEALPVRYNRDLQILECRIPSVFQPTEEWSHGGYERLHARLSWDQIERLPRRDSNVRRAWRYLPGMMGVKSILLM